MDWHKEMLFNAVAMSSLLFSSCDVELLNRVGANTTDKLSMVILFTDAFAATSARNLKNTETEEKQLGKINNGYYTISCYLEGTYIYTVI